MKLADSRLIVYGNGVSIVKSPPFVYHRPSRLEEVFALLDEHGDDAKILAGGQSLLPLMALRLGRPGHVIDIGRCDELRGIAVDDGAVTLGALVTHAEAERSAEVREFAPLVHQAMPWIAHRAIRTRGTVVGSIAHGDPAAEMPAVVLAAGGTLICLSSSGRREVAAADFFEGYLSTALRADEVLVGVRFPAWPSNAFGSVIEVSRRHGDYALVGVVVMLTIDGNTITDAALSFFGAAARPIRVVAAEQALIGSSPSPDLFAEAGVLAAAYLDPPADNHGSTAYRKHLAGVLTARGLDAAVASATTSGASV